MGILDIDWKGLALPFAYVIVLGSALMTFSRVYRKRKAGTDLSHPLARVG
jgi:translocation protein SEC66